MEEAKSDCEQSLFELKMALDEQAADAEAATMFGNWKRRGIWDYVFDLYPFADWPFDRRTGERRSATAVSQEEGGKEGAAHEEGHIRQGSLCAEDGGECRRRLGWHACDAGSDMHAVRSACHAPHP